mmetsp:Transcript_61753/g.155923  ORF Transcript_61753/g.155923 Transcript_61753/m.155923 type:complete len:251 (+) Transcript_61753:613-1365(+)
MAWSLLARSSSTARCNLAISSAAASFFNAIGPATGASKAAASSLGGAGGTSTATPRRLSSSRMLVAARSREAKVALRCSAAHLAMSLFATFTASKCLFSRPCLMTRRQFSASWRFVVHGVCFLPLPGTVMSEQNTSGTNGSSDKTARCSASVMGTQPSRELDGPKKGAERSRAANRAFAELRADVSAMCKSTAWFKSLTTTAGFTLKLRQPTWIQKSPFLALYFNPAVFPAAGSAAASVRRPAPGLPARC